MAQDIFRIADGTEMTAELLSTYIHKNDTITARRYRPLWKAYNNDYKIFHQRKKASWKPDHRLAVNFAQYITDTFEGFFLGNPIKTTSSDENVSEYVNYLDAYNDQDDGNAELSRIVSIFGRGYELYYTDEDGVECTAYLDPMESFMVYDEAIHPHPRYFVRTYIDSNNIKRGSISDEYTVKYFSCESGLLRWTGEEYEHHFDGVPAAEFIQNRARRGIFENVMSLIDEYNKTLSEKANDVDYFADAYMKVLGAKVDKETLKFMRDNRVINFHGKSAADLVVDFLQKPNGDTTQENLLNRLERLIFTIAMVVNLKDDEFGTSSGIALRYRLIPMLNLMKTKERKFTSGLNRRYKLLFSNPVSGMKEDDWTTLEFTFTPNFPIDLKEEAETAGALAGITSKKTQLKIISAVQDVDAELEQIEKEKDRSGYATNYPVNRTGGSDGDDESDEDEDEKKETKE